MINAAQPSRKAPSRAKKAFEVRRKARETEQGARQEFEHLPLLIFFEISCAASEGLIDVR
jgi:hypothetical protein